MIVTIHTIKNNNLCDIVKEKLKLLESKYSFELKEVEETNNKNIDVENYGVYVFPKVQIGDNTLLGSRDISVYEKAISKYLGVN